MPYTKNIELPPAVRDHLPPHAQDIYREAFNTAWEEYKKPKKRRGNAGHEETAHSVAWAAVEHEYKKDASGKWVRAA